MKFGEMHSSSNRGNLRGLKNRLYPGLVVSATVLSILMTSTSDAQLTYRELPGIGDQNKLRSIEVRQNTKDTVSLTVKDSSVEYVLRSLALQSRRPVLWDISDPRFSQKISVSISKKNILDAIRIAIENTDLIVNLASDGTTIMVKPRGDTSSSKSPTIGGGTVVGRILDSATRVGIPNVSVVIVGTKLVALSDASGAFRISSVPAGQRTVSVKIIGYISKVTSVTVTESRQSSATIYLVPSARTLNEVVTTATGAQRRVEVAHDIAKIDAAAVMKRSPVRTITDLLEVAQIPGVLVQRQSGDPGAPSKIRIRGIGSISQSNDPVIILDGVWIDGSRGRPSRIDDIDPSTIETVEIVRGPSAATLYGQDASNGIIVITSKKGTIGKTRWNLEYSRDWGEVYGKKPFMYEGRGRSSATSEARICNIADILRYLCVQDSVAKIDPNDPLLSQEGVETKNRYAVQLDGGVASIQYNISASTEEIIGVRRSAPVDLIRARLVGHEVNSEFDRPSRLARKSVSSGITLNTSENMTLGFRINGSQSDLTDNLYNLGFGKSRNSTDTLGLVLQSSEEVRNPSISTNVVLASSINWRPRSSYVVNGNLGVERFNGTEDRFSSKVTENRVPAPHDTTRNLRETSRMLYTARVNASTSLNLGALGKILSIRPSIGGDYKKTAQNQFIYNESKLNSLPQIPGLVVSSPTTGAYTKVENATAGWYVNSTLGLFQRLYFDVGLRQDIGSAITSSGNTKYPKLGSSWLVSDESFWPQNSIVSLFRLRGAIGHSAVQPDVTDIHGRYVGGFAYIDGRYVNSTDQTQTGNPRLDPERATEVEVGFDADLLDERINLIVTYARAQNTNALLNRTLPGSVGVGTTSARKENVGRVLNANLELATTIKALETSNNQLTFNYNLTVSNNKVTRLGTRVSPFTDKLSGVQVGYPLAGIWSRVVVGYIDVNNDGLLSSEEMVLSDSTAYLGWSQPRIKAGYGINWMFLNSITIDSRFVYQGSYNQQLTISNTYGHASQEASLPDQAAAQISNLMGKRNVSDLRWRSASISYFLPPQLLNRLKARSVNIALQASNIALWTNYVGRDPGVNSSILIDESISDNGNTTPSPRLYVLSIRWGL